jgi:hypothetical protein
VKPVSIAIVALLLGSCATSNQSSDVQSTASNLRTGGAGAAPSTVAPSGGSGVFQGLNRFAQAIGIAARGDNPNTPTSAETGSASPGSTGSGQAAAQAAAPAAQASRRVASVQGEAPRARPSETIGGTTAGATVAYERAMLQGDAHSMARAAARLTKKPITAESIRELNARLGIEANDAMVSAVVRAAR